MFQTPICKTGLCYNFLFLPQKKVPNIFDNPSIFDVGSVMSHTWL